MHLQIILRNSGRKLLIVPKQDEIRFHASHGNKKIFLVSENDVRIRECILKGFFSDLFGLLREFPFDFLHVQIACNNHIELTSLGGFAQDKMMTGMEVIEGTEDKNAHVCGNTGILEYWNTGESKITRTKSYPVLQYSITPVLYFAARSTTYSLFSSNT